MKKLLKTLIVFTSLSIFGSFKNPKQQQRIIKLEFFDTEVKILYDLIENAPWHGEQRKYFQNKIVTQYNAQMQIPKTDSIKPKKKN